MSFNAMRKLAIALPVLALAVMISFVNTAGAVNLLVNPGAETGDFTGWTVVNEGSGWAVNCAFARTGSCSFGSSYNWGTITQIVDLTETYTAEQLDTEPAITIGAYVTGFGNGSSTSDQYSMTMRLLDGSDATVAEYATGDQVTTASWQLISNEFTGYGTGVRKAYIQLRGKGVNGWAGQYGAHFDDASVEVALAVDSTAPTVVSYSPVDDKTNVDTATNFVIQFDETVVATGGNIVIKSSGGSVYETIASDSSLVTGSGTDTITINPSRNLGYDRGYYIEIQNTAFEDSSGNAFAGISGSTTWNIRTREERYVVRPENVTATLSETCSIDDAVELTIDGENITDIVYSEHAQFFGAKWERVAVPHMATITLSPEDGQKTLYIQARSGGNMMEEAIALEVEKDAEFLCGELIDETELAEERHVDEFGNQFVFVGEVGAYFVLTEDGERRFIERGRVMDSWKNVLPDLRDIELRTLSRYSLGSPVLERPGSMLLQFGQSPKIYALVEGEDAFVPVLRHLDSESIAVLFAGANWKEQIVRVEDGRKSLYEIGVPITADSFATQ